MSAPWGGGPPFPPQPGPYGAPPPYGPAPYGPAPYGPGAPLAPPPVVPPGAPPHDLPQPYPLLMRSRSWGWWRPLLGLLVFAVVYLLANLALSLLTIASGAISLTDVEELTDPSILLLNNALLIAAIPVVWLCWSALHDMAIGWSSSVLGRLRWRLLAPLTWRALATLGVWIGVQFLVEAVTADGSWSGPVDDFGWLVVVVVLTTPLQSAAEEYVFRGYLSQVVAGWIRAPRTGAVVAAVLTAGLFSLAHLPAGGVASLEFLDRFLFGLAASAVVWLTGGLEASIVLHAVNNVLVFLLSGLLGDQVDTSDAAGVPLLAVVLDAVAMGAYVGVVALSRRRLRTETVSPALDLRPASRPAPAGPYGGGPYGGDPYGGGPYGGGPYGGGLHGGGPYPGPGWGPPAGPPPADPRWARPGP